MRDHRLVRLRIELFVDDIDASIAFYTEMLGFRISRHTGEYAALVRGNVIVGLGQMAKLSEHDASGPGPLWQTAAGGRGIGVEIVLETDSADEVSAMYEHCLSRVAHIEALRLRPWGLHDFRLVDPDGYYLRVTHGNAEAS